MRSPGRAVYLLLVLLFCVAWASGFTVAKLAMTTAPPALFGGVRFLIAGGLLLGLAAWRGDFRRRVPWVTLSILGILNQAGYQGLAWQGMGTVSAGLATIIASLNPIIIATIAAPLLGERLHWRKVAGLLLGFAGAVFVVRHRLAGGNENPAGVLLIVGALLSLVAGTLAFKWAAPDVSLPVAVGVQMVAAGALLLVLGLAFEDIHAVTLNATFWLTMVWCIGVMSIGALLLWFWLLRNGSASSASALHFLIPPIGLAMAWLVLGEPVSPFDLLGVIPIGLGIWLATRPRPLRRAPVPLVPAGNRR
jgi:drug/metabolite transporter (DMT)-like permease